MPDPRQLYSSDWARRRTFSGRVAGPAAKLKTRSWDWVVGGGGGWIWVVAAVHLMDMGLKEVVVMRMEV